MTKDFHNKPFDDETILKLEIFKGYIREWLPVFLSRKTFSVLNIFDFFAGPGKDCNGTEGSPLIIIDELKQYLENPKFSLASDIEIKVLFNDADPNKIASLRKEISQENIFAVEATNLSFKDSFAAQKKELDGCWECNEFETCKELKFLEPVHGDAHIKNLRNIERKGKKEFVKGKTLWYNTKKG